MSVQKRMVAIIFRNVELNTAAIVTFFVFTISNSKN